MAQVVALNNQLHQTLKVDRQKAAEAIAEQHTLPVVITEFSKLVVDFPILLTKSQKTGQFVCVALLGFEEGENLFWQNAKFNSIYDPLNLARHPFFIGQTDEEDEEPLICIDLHSPAVTTTDGDALFTEQGKVSSYLKEIQQILTELSAGEVTTQSYINCLLNYELLIPLKLDITFANDSQIQIKGLYSIDEDKLKRLSLTEINELMQSGYLQTIYIQIASLGQIYALIERKNQRLSQMFL
jgi:hypothetical protein